jgi:hypothetical protein
MNESEELELQLLVKMASFNGQEVIWNPDGNTGRKIEQVAKHWDEPGLCGYFSGGEYVALYNCSLSDFVISTRLITKYE